MNVRIRAALVADIDALLAIENAAFATDRISRRSFRLLIERDTASVLVADEGDLTGYCVVLYRRGSGVARLYSIREPTDGVSAKRCSKRRKTPPSTMTG
jgi:ribosomal protein S18 acetylase RimI-like enzyme